MESLNSDCLSPDSSLYLEIEVNSIVRWDIYFRLQELEISCECKANRPLQVSIENPLAAIQLWSTIQMFTATKSSQTEHLERCWQKQAIT
jgi:hypothetical protein